jgi:phosphatidylserine decarboxylase
LANKNALFSRLCGIYQSHHYTRRHIQPFIDKFKLDASEFAEPVEAFTSFNDFFTRKLKPERRPIAAGEDVLVAPADGRYWVCQRVDKTEGFVVKGERFSLCSLLKNDQLAKRYEKGAMIVIRLCPTDYHRYHFPAAGIPSPSILINGYLHSVNPLAIKKNIHIFTENKRMICHLETVCFGTIVMIEIGATSVGTIHQTYRPLYPVNKGDEKGYFSFGGSSMILLIEPDRIRFDDDIAQASAKFTEMLCLFGQSLGRAVTA